MYVALPPAPRNIHTNRLTTLPEGVFQPLTALQFLWVGQRADK